MRSRRSTFPGLEALGYDLRLSPATVGVPALQGDPRAAGYCGASPLLIEQLLEDAVKCRGWLRRLPMAVVDLGVQREGWGGSLPRSFLQARRQWPLVLGS